MTKTGQNLRYSALFAGAVLSGAAPVQAQLPAPVASKLADAIDLWGIGIRLAMANLPERAAKERGFAYDSAQST